MRYIKESKHIKYSKQVDYLESIGFTCILDEYDGIECNRKVEGFEFACVMDNNCSISVINDDRTFCSTDTIEKFDDLKSFIEKHLSFIDIVWFNILEQYETFDDFILPIIDYGCDPKEIFFSYKPNGDLVHIYFNIEIDENDTNIKHLIERCEGLGLLFEPTTGDNYYLKFKWKQ